MVWEKILQLSNVLYIIILIFLSYLTIIWSYGLHFSIFEKISFKKGIGKSKKLVKGTFFIQFIIFSLIVFSGLFIRYGNNLFIQNILLLKFLNNSQSSIILKMLLILTKIKL